MVLAEVGLSDLIWTAVWVFFLIMVFWLFVAIVSDLFRDHSMSGWAKAAWVVGLVIFPFLGSLVYLVVRGPGMARRSMAAQQQAQAELDSYIRTTAASTGTGPVDDLTRLIDLRNHGAISDAEFEAIKSRVVSGSGAS
jgi:hypothetical protein